MSAACFRGSYACLACPHQLLSAVRWRDPADATDAAIRATVRNFEDCYKLGSDARRTFACLPPEWQRKHAFGLDHAASSEFVSLLRDSSTTYDHLHWLRSSYPMLLVHVVRVRCTR